ncbi:uncharacterized protein BDW47DRAFT_122053 [Aspergillus candidus]|uniref:Uncharacterized protein n=1 Tax=Aspergillus candidus TaxID=41067 RepID=A0A2I2FNT8_ASPCN|nr:hypothetical protein BDW47DRAFT_122053 [Aspergillus candidus]PLB42284.1 hypothetical protein BDW47DRAFT_122053 [Aspergillus candidus]
MAQSYAGVAAPAAAAAEAAAVAPVARRLVVPEDDPPPCLRCVRAAARGEAGVACATNARRLVCARCQRGRHPCLRVEEGHLTLN